MRETHITIPELGLVAGTRAALGAGLGLLVASRLTPEQRKAIGWTLFLVGALTTIPLVAEILGRACASSQSEPKDRSVSDQQPRMQEHDRQFAHA
jgi:hypothetical protein